MGDNMFQRLNDYELSCGYVQQLKVCSDHLFTITIELYKEHEAYHIRAFKRVNNLTSCTKLAWEIKDSFKEAQDEFSRLLDSIPRNK